jgi:DNA-binding transcriptional LysR family regulator
MELRHLRYFVAVAEEGSLTVAAERRLHTAQPSLSRQIRDLEYEVGAQLMTRSAYGIELTSARDKLSWSMRGWLSPRQRRRWKPHGGLHNRPRHHSPWAS